ncbi:1339_t:CDS:2, partial [Racocetra fulgida]
PRIAAPSRGHQPNIIWDRCTFAWASLLIVAPLYTELLNGIRVKLGLAAPVVIEVKLGSLHLSVGIFLIATPCLRGHHQKLHGVS